MGRIHLRPDGAILLGNYVSCDGFAWQRPMRVQTHIHHDHMANFNTSKANQTIIMSPATLDLLCALFDADLPYHTNIFAVECGQSHVVNGEHVELLPSNHMLGSVQVQVTCEDGYRVGYSSDFFWPVDSVIEVDELIVDATYGDPAGVRRFRQQDVDEKLIELVSARLRAGKATALIGYNGRLQYAASLLGHIAQCPIICSRRAFPLIAVYQKYGYAMPSVFSADSDDAISVLRRRELCVAFLTFQDRRHLPWVDRFAKISLSAYTTGPNEPVLDYGNGDCRVAFTDHADFEGTLQYVAATGARIVWTDPRSGNAEALAQAISQRLGVDSRIAPRSKSLAWG